MNVIPVDSSGTFVRCNGDVVVVDKPFRDVDVEMVGPQSDGFSLPSMVRPEGADKLPGVPVRWGLRGGGWLISWMGWSCLSRTDRCMCRSSDELQKPVNTFKRFLEFMFSIYTPLLYTHCKCIAKKCCPFRRLVIYNL